MADEATFAAPPSGPAKLHRAPRQMYHRNQQDADVLVWDGGTPQGFFCDGGISPSNLPLDGFTAVPSPPGGRGVSSRRGSVVFPWPFMTWISYEQGKLEEIIDIDIGDDLDVYARNMRPNMSSVVQMLIGESAVSMDKVAKPVVISDSGLKADEQRRLTDALSPVMKSFDTTARSTSSEVTTQPSV